MTTKRVVLLGDFHCGHVAGITPPAFQFAPGGGEYRDKFGKLQAECWAFYSATIARLQPVDVLIANGDLIDGNGKKSGGTEEISTDPQVQCDMAVQAIKLVKAKHVVITAGTGYHVGDETDWEESIAERVSAKFGSHEWVDVSGVVFDVKHHLGSSSVPHGRHTAISRDRIWNLMWALREDQPRANFYVRSHVHYHSVAGGAGWIGMTLPALQAARTKYGGRRCSGTVDYGLVHVDINSNGAHTWQAHLADLRNQRSTVIKL